MVELMVAPQAQLPPGIACQVLSFLRVNWPEGFVGENRLRDWITHEKFHPESFVLVEKGILIAHAQVVWKMLEHSGIVYKTYGLTGVFTYPSFQGQGYGLQVVQAATRSVAQSDADIGMFHCDPKIRHFYSLAGWQAMEGSTTWLGDRASPDLSKELMMMQFFSEKGRNGRESFTNDPVFFDEDSTW